MIWFVVGALLGAIQMGVSVARKPLDAGFPIQGMIVAAVLGAAIYGTILWVIVTYVF